MVVITVAANIYQSLGKAGCYSALYPSRRTALNLSLLRLVLVDREQIEHIAHRAAQE